MNNTPKKIGEKVIELEEEYKCFDPLGDWFLGKIVLDNGVWVFAPEEAMNIGIDEMSGILMKMNFLTIRDARERKLHEDLSTSSD